MRTGVCFHFWDALIRIGQVGSLVPCDEDMLTLFDSWRQRMGSLDFKGMRYAVSGVGFSSPTVISNFARLLDACTWFPSSQR